MPLSPARAPRFVLLLPALLAVSLLVPASAQAGRGTGAAKVSVRVKPRYAAPKPDRDVVYSFFKPRAARRAALKGLRKEFDLEPGGPPSTLIITGMNKEDSLRCADCLSFTAILTQGRPGTGKDHTVYKLGGRLDRSGNTYRATYPLEWFETITDLTPETNQPSSKR